MPTPEPSRKRPLTENEQPVAKKGKPSNRSTEASSANVTHFQTASQSDLPVESRQETSETFIDLTDGPSSLSSVNTSKITDAVDFTRPTSHLVESNNSDSSTSVDTYDTCFGLLCVKAIAIGAAAVPSECTPVTLNFDGRLVKAVLKDLDQPVAVLLSTSLQRLVSNLVILNATICGKKQKAFADQDTAQEDLPHLTQLKPDCTLRIIVYGFERQQDEIAKILATEGLFLQHPAEFEFDRRVKYRNPQYLLPPGAEMPCIENLSIYTCCGGNTEPEPRRHILGENEGSQIFNIFNTALISSTDAPTIEPSPRLETQLMSHQSEALVMMIEKEAGKWDGAHFPTVWTPVEVPDGHTRYQNIVTKRYTSTRPQPIGGGILADEMGLGKTLTALSLICYSLDQFDKNPDLSHGMPRSTLIITPKSTIYGWEKQIKVHTRPGQVTWITYQGTKRQQAKKNINSSDIVLTTYDTLRSDSASEEPCLFEQNWGRVVLDEAHRIRNSSSKIFSDVLQLNASCRWCLTGTPIQNSLSDFGSLLAFVKVPHLDTKDEFQQYIEIPMKDRSGQGLELLRKVVAATCLRRTKATQLSTLKLTRKTERTERVEMGRSDRDLYNFFKSFARQIANDKATLKINSPNSILVLISTLRLICDHGKALLPSSALRAWENRDMSALTWESLKSNSKRCVDCGRDVEELNTGESNIREFSCGDFLCGSCETASQGSYSQTSCPLCSTAMAESPLSGGNSRLSPDRTQIPSPTKGSWPASAKVEALIRNILDGEEGEERGKQSQKSVVFSFWTKMLDLIEVALKSRGILFCRIDGKATMKQRREALEAFENDSSHNLMLASISAAGEGIDLTAASTVHIVEPHWNPMAEAQAIDRVHRIGQSRDVEVVRYIVNGSIELYMQWVQNDKIRLISQSLSTSDEDSDMVSKTRVEELCKYLE